MLESLDFWPIFLRPTSEMPRRSGVLLRLYPSNHGTGANNAFNVQCVGDFPIFQGTGGDSGARDTCLLGEPKSTRHSAHHTQRPGCIRPVAAAQSCYKYSIPRSSAFIASFPRLTESSPSLSSPPIIDTHFSYYAWMQS